MEETPSPQGNEVIDYCDTCGSLITWNDQRVTVTSNQGPDRVLCGPCSDAEQDAFWNAPLDFD